MCWPQMVLLIEQDTPYAKMPKKPASTTSHTHRTHSLGVAALRSETDVARLHQARVLWLYGLGSALVLLLTTCWWSALGALVNLQNADQLVNGHLFESLQTLERASFSAQHTFLLKWPLFYLIKLLGLSSGAFVGTTIAVCLVTVGLLMWLIRRLERRPLYFGTLYLALASCLLLVPIMPYPGGLLPVSMAMVTTRNIEYALFIGLLAYAVNLRRLSSRHFLAVAAGATLLFASDRLFVAMALAGALLGCVAFLVSRHYFAARLHSTWLGVAVGSTVLAKALVAFIGILGITNFVNDAAVGPYQFSHSLHTVATACFYAVVGVFTNLGANPGSDATTLRDIVSTTIHHLLSPAGPAYLVNAMTVLAGLAALFLVARRTYGSAPVRTTSLRRAIATAPEAFIPRADRLALTLAWAAVAASLAYILTNHQYVVDARYLGIWPFCLFVCLAVYAPSLHWPVRRVAAIGVVLLFAVVGGLWGASRNFISDTAALSDVADRNQTIVQALHSRRTALLVGDYWRTLPIRQIDRRLTVTPLDACTQARQVLSSKVWQPDLTNHGFAYLLSTDRSLTDFPHCDFKTIIHEYGQPSASLLIAGSIRQPREVLLFYDHGTTYANHRLDSLARTASGGIPSLLGRLSPRRTFCNGQPTVMNIVAHQDDDILFMNPDISHDIAASHCVRTIYLTAGDAGGGSTYWLGRERGSESAYGTMLGNPNIAWTEQTINLGKPGGDMPNEYVTVATPAHSPKVSLVFMHLPDGDLHGQGFASSRHESLTELRVGSLERIQSVDGQSEYTEASLTKALTELMQLYNPTVIRTQAVYNGSQISDHSDHRAVGYLATAARQQYEQADVDLQYFLGYPGREHPANLSGNDLNQKLSVFFAYAHYDGGVCRDQLACQQTPTYGSYLQRQYRYLPETGEVIPEPAP